MKNYFYDVLPIDLQQYIIKIEEELNKKCVIKKVYIPWYVRLQQWTHSIEEYRHIINQDGKIWYMDLLINSDECGGTSMLKVNDNDTVISLYKCCDVIDEIVFLKLCKHTGLQKSINKRMWDLEYDVFVGNYWENGYVSPLDDHLELANESYDDAIMV